MVLDRSKKGRMTKLFGQKNYLETAPSVLNQKFMIQSAHLTIRGLL